MSLKIYQISNRCITPLKPLGLCVTLSVPNASCPKQCLGQIGDILARFGISCGAYAAPRDPKFSLRSFLTYFQKCDFWNVFFCKNKRPFCNKYKIINTFSGVIHICKIYFHITENEAVALAREVHACAGHVIIRLFDCLGHWQLLEKDWSLVFGPETTQERGAA